MLQDVSSLPPYVGFSIALRDCYQPVRLLLKMFMSEIDIDLPRAHLRQSDVDTNEELNSTVLEIRNLLQ